MLTVGGGEARALSCSGLTIREGITLKLIVSPLLTRGLVQLLAVTSVADEGFGGGFAGFDRAFHKTLPIGDVLAGEEDFAVRALEDRADAEPLAGFVESVGTVSVRIALPGVGDDAAGETWGVSVEVLEIAGDDPHPAFVGLG